jgi:gamma-glutamyltranspeptidase/glutathione hydrolase
MIVAPQPYAVEEGARVLIEGGNAVDAAVTCAFVQGIVSPQMCGIGGYALLNVQLADGTNALLDAPAEAGSKVSADMWRDIVIGPNPDGWGYFLQGKVNDAGYQSICTPGTTLGLATMLERWGTISLERAIEPAARLADEGFTVETALANGWKTRARFKEACSLLDYIRLNEEASRIYLKDGRPYDDGETLRNPDHARTLRHIARYGAQDFYTGELSERIAADLAANGAFVTAEDLAGYRLRDEQPVVGTYRGYTVSTSQSPHGGPTLLAILNILEGYELGKMEHNSPEYIYLVAMAMKAAFADRNPYMGDPKFVDVPLEWMTSKRRAEQWRKRIDAGEEFAVQFTASEPPDTTHVSVVDKHGNCASLTHSLGISSGVITPGLGFIYNNSMTNFHPYGGHPNSIAPGKGRTTGIAPTIVSKDGKPVLVIGAPGATRIVTGVLSAILNILDFGMSPAEAILAPRFDCQGETIRAQARIPELVCAQVRRRHPIARLPQSHGVLGLVHAIGIDPATGALRGGADTGSGGMALQV